MYQKRIGIYHKNCTDGTTAGAVLLRKFPDIKLFPLVHSHTEDDLEHIHKIAGEGSEVYFVDFATGVEEFLDKKHNIFVIDHHLGAKEKMEKLEKENLKPASPSGRPASSAGKLKYIFDNNKSGASLAWQYFFKDEKEPEIIKYVEDSDLWTGKYEETKYVSNYLSMFSNNPEYVLELMESDINEIKEKGKIISDYADIQIKRIVEGFQEIKLRIGKYEVFAYNITMYESVVGNKLSVLQNQAVAMFTISGNSVNFSFRGNDNNSPTALDLAELLGGGGHQNASGATIYLEDFLKMIIQ